MQTNGKILLFNPTDGLGTIISTTKEKVKFSVEDWNDFDVMPSMGLEVSFNYQNYKASSIISVISMNSPKTIKSGDETKHFEIEEEIGTIEDIEDEIGKKKEKVNLTTHVSKSVHAYFDTINENIDKRAPYKKVKGSLNYLIVRRFLWTTFNNLNEIDIEILTPQIKALSKDLKEMSTVYDDFVRKTKYPALAYEEVFLACQAEYLGVRDSTQKTIEKLSLLKNSEQLLGGALKIKKKELEKNIEEEDFTAMEDDFKSLNGTYVDVVHMMAELDARYKHDMKLLKAFEKEYETDFYDLFNKASVKYKSTIVDILSSQAYLLDQKLWKEAKSSEALQIHFKKAGVTDELSTKTYLKYYLESLDSTKSNAEDKRLFELYDYLSSLHKDTILILSSSAQDAMEYEADIKKVSKSYEVKSFIDEKSALQWAIKSSVKVLVIEDKLIKMQVDSFFKHYKKHVFTTPKIILLGNQSKTDLYVIDKTLSKGVSAHVIVNHIKEFLD